MDWNERSGGNVPLTEVIATVTNAALSRIPAEDLQKEGVDRTSIMKTVEDGIAAMTRAGIYFTTTPSVLASQIGLRNAAVQAECANFIHRLENSGDFGESMTAVEARKLVQIAAQESSRGLDALADAGIFLGRKL